MKNVIALFIFILSFAELFPQIITPEEKAVLLGKISDIQSYDYDVTGIYYTLKAIQQYKVYEAIPVIDTSIWKVDVALQANYLETLVELNAPSARQKIYAYYDTLNSHDMNSLSKLFQELEVNELLLRYNDFSKTDIVFSVMEESEYLNEDALHILAIRQLPIIIRNAPEYEARAKALLEQAVTDEVENHNRKSALYYLEDIYKYNSYPFMKIMLEEDSCADNRYLALQYAEKYPTNEFKSLLRDALFYEYDTANLFAIYELLLSEYSCPLNFNYLLEYLPTEPDPEAQNYLQSILSLHEIRRPDESRTVLNLIDSLSSYVVQCSSLSWIDTSLANTFIPMIESARNFLILGDSISCAKQFVILKQKADYEYYNSLNVTENYITDNGRIFLNAYAQHILDRLPAISEDLNYNIKLLNSAGTLLTGGSLQYYEGAWKDAVNNGDGTFLVNTSHPQVSLRMTYEYGTQTLSNVSLANGNLAVFQTINTEVKLQDSNGSPIDTGTVQYYAGAWHQFGITTNGTAYKELLPNNYSFRMTYANASNDKQQNIGANPTVTFQTVNAAVELRNSTGTLMDAGTWRPFGTTTNGSAYKELLPNNYSFRMTYANASNDKQQNIGANPTVTFQTVNAAVELRNSTGTLMDAGTVQYYAGAWREFGNTANGIAYKELLPNNYSFRMTHEYISNDKQQNIGTSNMVTFATIAFKVSVKNTEALPVDNADIKYYAGAWRPFGITVGGEAVKELLPANLTFRASYNGSQKDKVQNTAENNTVEFVFP